VIGDILQPSHLLFILVIALLVLGPKRLPEVGRALGRGLRDFRNAINTDELHDQMIGPMDAHSAPPAVQPSAQATEAPVDQPTHQAAPNPGSIPASWDDAASSPEGPVQSSEPTATAPTRERVP
jgi:sec-independent protein translocase protein TatA